MAIIVVVLLTFIWFFEKDVPSSAERAELESKVVRAERDEINSVRIETGKQIVLLELVQPASSDGLSDPVASRWMIRQPFEARADPKLIDDLLDALEGLEIHRALEAVDPIEAGLEPPRSRLVIDHDSGVTELEIGAEIPASSSMLVRMLESGSIVVVDSGVWEHLERDPGDWRDRSLVRVGSDEISRVVISKESDEVVLARRPSDDFWIESPFEDLAGKDQVGDLLTALTGLRADRFVDSPDLSDAEMGLDSPLAIIEFWAEGPEAVRIDLGAQIADQSDSRYVRLEGQIVETSSNLIAGIERTAEQWRSLDLTTLETYQIDRLKIEDPNRGSWDLVRSGADWLRNDETISFTTVSDLLYSIVDARASAVSDATPATVSDQSSLLFSATLISDAAEESLTVFRRTDDGPLRVVVRDRDVVLLLDPKTFSDIEEKFAAVRSAEGRSEDNLVNDIDPDGEEGSDRD